MKNKAHAMVLASFAADSLALGAHWIYDTRVIVQQFGRVENYVKPLKDSYHPAKDKGEFTHYGDQARVLLESIAAVGGFDPDYFSRQWQDLFNSYQGYVDQATRKTLENFAAGKDLAESGSGSSDLGGAARISPLVYRYRTDSKKLIAAAKAQTAMTHNNPQVVESAEFFARVVSKVLGKISPLAALEQVMNEGFDKAPFNQWVAGGIASAGKDSKSAIAGFGQMCETGAAFPSAIHLIVKYEDNLKEALVENVMSGGDSAARGMIVGMILGAFLGFDALPEKWIQGLKNRDIITSLLKKIDAKTTS
jgi:ADP-ribosylglycohydrolase